MALTLANIDASDMRGLVLNVYRWNGPDCSNKGLSSRVDKVTLVGIIDQREDRSSQLVHQVAPSCRPFSVTPEAPAVVLVYRTVFGRMACHVQPAEPGWWMAGGAFVAGDSRFTDLAGFYGAVKLHDRRE